MTQATPALTIDLDKLEALAQRGAGASPAATLKLIAAVRALPAASQGAQQAEPVAADLGTHESRCKAIRDLGGTAMAYAVQHGKISLDTAVRCSLAAPAATAEPKVPEGFALVPLRVTPEMRAAWDRAPQGEDDDRNFFDAYNAMLNASPVPRAEWDLDDYAVQAFAGAMRSKMAKSRAKGRGGWERPEQCPTERLQLMLLEHLKKGDPVDVANFCMMLWTRGAPVVGVDLKAACQAVLEDAAAICDNFAKRDMHPSECAGAIRMMKGSIK